MKVSILESLLLPALLVSLSVLPAEFPCGRLCKSGGHRGSLFQLFLLSCAPLDPLLPTEVENSCASLMRETEVVGSPEEEHGLQFRGILDFVLCQPCSAVPGNASKVTTSYSTSLAYSCSVTGF